MNRYDVTDSAEQRRQVTSSIIARPSKRRRFRRWLASYRWLLIACMWIVAIALGYIGFSRYFLAIGETHSYWDILYSTLQLFVLESGAVSEVGWELQIARFLAPVMAVYTAIQTLAMILQEQLQLFRVRFLKKHIVICGLGRKGLLLAQRFRENGERVVVIEEDGNNSWLQQCQEYGAISLIGDAADPRLLHTARVHKAKYLISVCGDDGVNAEVAVHARELISTRRGRALVCLIHISGLQLYNLLREREIGMGELDKFRLEFFNVFESGARILLNEYPPFDKIGGNGSSRAHILLVGAGRIGESLIVNAATRWRDAGASGESLRITLVDGEADRTKEFLSLQYPQLDSVCELVSRQMDTDSPEFERADFIFDQSGHCDVTIAYVCLDDDATALSTALLLHQRIRAFNIPIIVRMTQSAGLATLLTRKQDGYDSFTNLHAFGLFDHTCTPDLIFKCTYEILARCIHENYVRSERAKGSTPQLNPSLVPWEELPESLKESNRSQAEHVRFKLEAIGCGIAVTTDWDVQPFIFSTEEIELMARLEHERFVEERLHQGFRYGPTKDIDKKTNPTLVPWSKLSEEERDKDRDIARNLSVLLARARFQVYRL
jgi:voltage-gated potassium channel Kch